MPSSLTSTAILVLFYAVFTSQIFLLSIYYPKKIHDRVRYILEQFPASEYPKLYPGPYDNTNVEKGDRKLRFYMGVNYCIVLIGVAILVKMLTSNYQPAPEGGDEIFVMLYFFLQAAPLLYAEIKEYTYHKLLRENYVNSKRTADLKPRRLFDFVSPIAVLAAIACYILMMILYISSRDFSTQPHIEIYGTIIGMSLVQVMFAAVTASHLYGKKTNPYMSHDDQLVQIGVIAKIMVFASIGASVFLTITELVDQYSLEVIDPVLSSLYFQFCVIFGVGFAFKTMRIEKLDFSGLKETKAP